MEAEYGTYEYEKDKGMEKDHIKFWYRQDDCPLTFELSLMMCKERKKLIMSIDLLIGRDHGK